MFDQRHLRPRRGRDYAPDVSQPYLAGFLQLSLDEPCKIGGCCGLTLSPMANIDAFLGKGSVFADPAYQDVGRYLAF
jgi:hypothetical protein